MADGQGRMAEGRMAEQRENGWLPLVGLRRLGAATAAATLLLIAMGGAVRATDSGLACPDWPACYGRWIPPADLNMWMEHSHRLWAGVVGLLIAWLTIWILLRHRDQPILVVASVAAALLVLIQSGLGAAVVLFHLRAPLVTAHLGMSFVIVACLITITVLAGRVDTVEVEQRHRRTIGRGAAVLAAAVFGQALLGGQATGRGAAYVFNRVPIWLTDDPWTGHAREVLHVTHRVAGYLVAVAVIAFAVWAIRRQRRAGILDPWGRRLLVGAVALVLLQVGLGIANVLTEAGVVSAVGHLAGASWLWGVLIALAVRGLQVSRRRPGGPAPSEAAQTEAAGRAPVAADGTSDTAAAPTPTRP